MFVMYHCELWDWTMGILNFCSKKVYRVPEYDRKSGDSVFRKIRFGCMGHQRHIIRLAKLSWTFFTHFGDLSLNPQSRMYVFWKFGNFPLCDQGRAFLYEEGDSERVPAMSSKTMDASFRSEGIFGCHGFMSYFVGDAQFLFVLLVSSFLFCWLRLNSGVPVFF